MGIATFFFEYHTFKLKRCQFVTSRENGKSDSSLVEPLPDHVFVCGHGVSHAGVLETLPHHVVKVVLHGRVSLCSHHLTVSAIINSVAISNQISVSIKVDASETLWLFHSALAVPLFRKPSNNDADNSKSLFLYQNKLKFLK